MSLNGLEKVIRDKVEELNHEDMVNERKKRIAFATANEYLFKNPTIKVTNQEIDNLIEEVVKNG